VPYDASPGVRWQQSGDTSMDSWDLSGWEGQWTCGNPLWTRQLQPPRDDQCAAVDCTGDCRKLDRRRQNTSRTTPANMLTSGSKGQANALRARRPRAYPSKSTISSQLTQEGGWCH
jgi:hypothetical protein